MKVQVGESLGVDLDAERWVCWVCAADLGPARANYKEGCLVADRDPRDVHGRSASSADGLGFTPDPRWCRVVEFYCPGCATLLEVEYLPPGHPLTHELELDIDALKARFSVGAGQS